MTDPVPVPRVESAAAPPPLPPQFVAKGTAEQQAIVARGVAACDYPWARLTQTVTVSWRDLSAEGAYGLYWPGRYLIELDTSLVAQPALGMQVMLAEAAHAVDDQTLDDTQRAAIAAAYHPSGGDGHAWFDSGDYSTWLGEALMAVFIAAFAPSVGYAAIDRLFVHKVSPQVAAAVRSIVLGDAPQPPTPPSTVDPADQRLADATRAWSAARHTGANRNAAAEVVTWRTAKGL